MLKDNYKKSFFLCFSRKSFLVFLSNAIFCGIIYAQEITATHLQIAKQAIAAIHATDQFDAFLPYAARELKDELMRKDPNLEKIISETVDLEALKLAVRRGDLEKEVAYAYARHFDKDELKEITEFYSSPAGKKLLGQGPEVMKDAISAYEIWRQGIAQDLSVNVGKKLDERFASMLAK